MKREEKYSNLSHLLTLAIAEALCQDGQTTLNQALFRMFKCDKKDKESPYHQVQKKLTEMIDNLTL